MKTSLATLVLPLLLLLLTVAACAGASATSGRDALAGSEPDNSIIQTERSNARPPELPPGCAFSLEDRVSYVLTCAETAAFLSRLELVSLTPPVVEAHIASVRSALEKGGWTVARGATYPITADTGVIELTHLRGVRKRERANSYSGFVTTGPSRFRYFTCFLPDELNEGWPGECAVRLQLLRALARAYQVVGFRMHGEPVEIPSGCRLMEGGLRCETSVFTWTEFSASVSDAELRRRERTLARTFPNALQVALTCEFLGEPIECSGRRIENDRGLPQLVIYGYTTIDDAKLRLICEAAVPAVEPQTLPACDAFMDIEFVE